MGLPADGVAKPGRVQRQQQHTAQRRPAVVVVLLPGLDTERLPDQAGRQQLHHQGKRRAFVAAERQLRSCQDAGRVGGGQTVGADAGTGRHRRAVACGDLYLAARHRRRCLVEDHRLAARPWPAECHRVGAEERFTPAGRRDHRHVGGETHRHQATLDQFLDVDPQRRKMVHVDDRGSCHALRSGQRPHRLARVLHRQRGKTPVAVDTQHRRGQGHQGWPRVAVHLAAGQRGQVPRQPKHAVRSRTIGLCARHHPGNGLRMLLIATGPLQRLPCHTVDLVDGNRHKFRLGHGQSAGEEKVALLRLATASAGARSGDARLQQKKRALALQARRKPS